MKIASVCIHYPAPDDPVRGIFVQNRLKALAQLADVHVISPRPWFPFIRPSAAVVGDVNEFPSVSRPRMFYLPGLLKGADSFWLKRVLVPQLRRLQQTNGVDLIDAHFEYPEAVGAVQAARQLNLPVFVTVRGLLKKYLALPTHRQQIIQSLQQATGIITVSESLRQEVLEVGIDESKIIVIPNAVDCELFRLPLPHTIRGRLGISEHEKLIVAVGHIVPNKGFRVLIEAFQILRRNVRSARLVIIGKNSLDGTHFNELQELVRSNMLGDVCTFLGQQPAPIVADWLGAADAFALPTAREGCCNSVLEALATGTPVVTTPAGDNAFYVTSGENGAIVPVGDVEGFASALTTVLNQQWDRNAISEPIRKRKWSHVAKEVLSFFTEQAPFTTNRPTLNEAENFVDN